MVGRLLVVRHKPENINTIDFDLLAAGLRNIAVLSEDFFRYGAEGLNAQPDGANIPLNLSSSAAVKFYYDHKTHWVTDNHSTPIAVAVGSFQSMLGCPGDWQPDCLRSWLEDPSGSGTFTFTTTAIPVGTYQAKVAINESWAENYGAGGAPGGDNIPFTVTVPGSKVVFLYNSSTHLLTIRAVHALDDNVEWDGLRHDSRVSARVEP